MVLKRDPDTPSSVRMQYKMRHNAFQFEPRESESEGLASISVKRTCKVSDTRCS